MKTLKIYERGVDSIAVWGFCAENFLVGELSLTAHATAVAWLGAQRLELFRVESHLDTARSARNSTAERLRDLTTRACLLIAGTALAGDALESQLQAVYRVRSDSFGAVKDKGEKLVIAWQATNAWRATLSPAQPPLLVGTTPVEELKSLLEAYDALLKDIPRQEDPVRTGRAALHATARRVDRNNKRWHQAWRGQFPADSTERAALRQVDTGRRQPKPGPATFLGVRIQSGPVVAFSFGASRAQHFTLRHQGPGETDFTVLVEEWKERDYEHRGAVPGEHRYQVTGHNRSGAGTASKTLVVLVPPPPVTRAPRTRSVKRTP